VASFDPELHSGTLRNLAMKFGVVTSAEEVIASLRGTGREVAVSKGP
jgi:hypothetical protein